MTLNRPRLFAQMTRANLYNHREPKTVRRKWIRPKKYWVVLRAKQGSPELSKHMPATHLHTHTHTHTHTHPAHTHTHTPTTHIPVHTHTCTHTHLSHTHICTHTHPPHTHTYTHTPTTHTCTPIHLHTPAHTHTPATARSLVLKKCLCLVRTRDTCLGCAGRGLAEGVGQRDRGQVLHLAAITEFQAPMRICQYAADAGESIACLRPTLTTLHSSPQLVCIRA